MSKLDAVILPYIANRLGCSVNALYRDSTEHDLRLGWYQRFMDGSKMEVDYHICEMALRDLNRTGVQRPSCT